MVQDFAGDVLNEKVTIFDHHVINHDSVIHLVIGLTISLLMRLIPAELRRSRKALNYAHPRTNS